MNAKTIISWVLAVLLAVAFLGAGAAKLASVPMMIAEFTTFGYPLWFMYVTGTFEIIGAVAVLIPRSAPYGAAWLSAIMIGAIFSHLTHGQATMIAAPVILLIVALVFGSLRGWGRAAKLIPAH